MEGADLPWKKALIPNRRLPLLQWERAWVGADPVFDGHFHPGESRACPHTLGQAGPAFVQHTYLWAGNSHSKEGVPLLGGGLWQKRY